jgi:hypothetical protein
VELTDSITIKSPASYLLVSSERESYPLNISRYLAPSVQGNVKVGKNSITKEKNGSIVVRVLS